MLTLNKTYPAKKAAVNDLFKTFSVRKTNISVKNTEHIYWTLFLEIIHLVIIVLLLLLLLQPPQQ